MKVKIVAFSDIHGQYDKIILPECDIAILAGDETNIGTHEETKKFLDWYDAQKQCTHRIWINGNHSIGYDPKFDKNMPNFIWRDILNAQYPDLTYLNNSSVNIWGLNIYGSPITPWFHGDHWAFNRHRGEEISKEWDKIPVNTDILVTHGPCFGILDYIPGEQVPKGCESLLLKVQEIKPKLHIFGHLHHDGGKIQKVGETTFINAAVLDDNYKFKNNPVEITLEI